MRQFSFAKVFVLIASAIAALQSAEGQSSYPVTLQNWAIPIVNPQTHAVTTKTLTFEIHAVPLNYSGSYPLRTSNNRPIYFLKLISADFTTQQKNWLDLEFELQNAAYGINASSRLQSSTAKFDCFAFALAGNFDVRVHELSANIILVDDFTLTGPPSMQDAGLRRAVGCDGFNIPDHATFVVTELQETNIPGILAPVTFGVAKCGVQGIYRPSLSGMMGMYGVWPDLDYYVPQ